MATLSSELLGFCVTSFEPLARPSFDEDLFGALKPNYEEHRATWAEMEIDPRGGKGGDP